MGSFTIKAVISAYLLIHVILVRGFVADIICDSWVISEVMDNKRGRDLVTV